jgi:hypothetical protein
LTQNSFNLKPDNLSSYVFPSAFSLSNLIISCPLPTIRTEGKITTQFSPAMAALPNRCRNCPAFIMENTVASFASEKGYTLPYRENRDEKKT